MPFRDIPRSAIAVVVLFWLSTIATDVASFYLDPEIGLANVHWPQFFAKRTALSLFWITISLAALVWYRDRPIIAANLWPSVLLAAAVGVLVYALYSAYFAALFVLLSRGAMTWTQALGMTWSPDLLYAYFTLWQIVIAANAYHYYRRLQREQRESEQLQLKLARTELMLFRAQLEPHFLFNALNSIASLVRLQRNEAAIDALNQLGGLLRGVLDMGQRQTMPWQWEHEFTRMYVALQKLRFGERLEVVFDVDLPAATEVPVLMLQPLIENAIHHGALRDAEHCDVRVRLRREDGDVVLTVANTRARTRPEAGNGVGLTNLAARLQAIHGARAVLRHGEHDGRYLVEARFPLVTRGHTA
jgi:hypothetical protein